MFSLSSIFVYFVSYNQWANQWAMATITVRIRKDRSTNGEAPIELLVFHKGSNRQISLKRKVNPEHWDDHKKMVKSGPTKQITNSIIKRESAKIQAIIDKITLADETISLTDIIEKYKGKSDSTVLVDYLKDYLEDNPDNLKYVTIKTYNTCLSALEEFNSAVKLAMVDAGFIADFEKFLITKGNRVNTIFNRLKVIRKIMRRARREGRIDTNPFEFYKIKTESSKRDFLTVQELQSLWDLEGLAQSYELTRDVYVFSATAGGVRFGDLCKLKRENVNDRDGITRLQFRSSKTDQLIEFKLSMIPLSIIEKYSDEDRELLFPILDYVSTDDKELVEMISRRNAYFNKVLKVLSKKAGIPKNLSMHTARHTFATISLSKDIQTEVVGKILGHKDLKTTQIYTKILDKSKDEASDKWDDILS